MRIIYEMITIFKITLNKYYFQYNENFYKPKTAIAVGSPYPVS
jgi:hypothetical protein